jgi:dTDP-glucose 4,6-dehydratase
MIRATNVYGAYQQLFKIIPRSIINIMLNKTIELHGGGVAVKSYIHIRDVSRGELLAMEGGLLGQIYHLSPDHGVQVCDVVRKICKYLNVPFENATKIVAERLGQDKAYIIDSTKVRTQLQWRPEISLDQGLQLAISWIQDHFRDIVQHPLQYIHKD